MHNLIDVNIHEDIALEKMLLARRIDLEENPL